MTPDELEERTDLFRVAGLGSRLDDLGFFGLGLSVFGFTVLRFRGPKP